MRLRVRFSKTGKIRFIGHRDVARVTERAARKVGLPVAYSEGFSPRMRMSFGLALPTGYESDGEYVELPLIADSLLQAGVERGPVASNPAVSDPSALDQTVLDPADSDTVAGGPVIVCRDGAHAPCPLEAPAVGPSYCTVMHALAEALPVGMDVCAAVLTDGSGLSLQAAVRSCGWQFEIVGLGQQSAAASVAELLDAGTVVTERVHKGETVSSDIRPSVIGLQVVGCSDRGAVLHAELSATPRVVRPSELVSALAPNHDMGIARRTHQWICGAEGRAEPAEPSRCAQLQKETFSG